MHVRGGGQGSLIRTIWFPTISDDIIMQKKSFDFMLSNPPYGTPMEETDLKAGDCKKDEIPLPDLHKLR